jgi:hypothetical protein
MIAKLIRYHQSIRAKFFWFQSGIGAPYQWFCRRSLPGYMQRLLSRDLLHLRRYRHCCCIVFRAVLVLFMITAIVVLSRNTDTGLPCPFTDFICRRRCLQPMHSWHILYGARCVGSVGFWSTVVQRPWSSLNENDPIKSLGCFLHWLNDLIYCSSPTCLKKWCTFRIMHFDVSLSLSTF